MKNPFKSSKSAEERDLLRWYLGTAPRPFDPMPFVNVAMEDWADRPDLIALLAQCKRQWPSNGMFSYLHDRSEENRKGVQWCRAGGRWLQCPVYGEVLIDLHTRIDDPHHWGIAAIEFMDKMGAADVMPAPYEPRMRVVHSKHRSNT
ncbi:MAG: hypothetical protein IPG74_12890 [Flavobacteriales bacterium]|nr:hypothetical protein [Flavobacteriales bacterium]